MTTFIFLSIAAYIFLKDLKIYMHYLKNINKLFLSVYFYVENGNKNNNMSRFDTICNYLLNWIYTIRALNFARDTVYVRNDIV